MGSCMPGKSSFNGDKCKWLCNSYDDESSSEHEHCSHGAALGDLCVLGVSEEDDFVVEELETALNDILSLSGSHERWSDKNSVMGQDEVKNEAVTEEISLVTCSLKDLDDSEVYQLADEQGYSPCVISIEGLSSLLAHAGSFPEPDIKFISALKGSRAREGLATNTKLSVKWAPDVYDPPPTSESHTVKSHRRHSKHIRKDYHKQKHSMSNSYRSHGGDKKQASHISSRRSHISSRSSTDPRISRLKVLNARVLTHSPGHSKVEALGYALMTKELKCGGSIFTESPAFVHLPLAEAS